MIVFLIILLSIYILAWVSISLSYNLQSPILGLDLFIHYPHFKIENYWEWKCYNCHKKIEGVVSRPCPECGTFPIWAYTLPNYKMAFVLILHVFYCCLYELACLIRLISPKR